MKIIILLLFACLGLSLPVKSQPSEEYRVEVIISNTNQGDKAVLRYFTDTGPDIDSASLSDGKFVFRGKMPSNGTIAKLFLIPEKKGERNNNFCEVFLEPLTIKITASADLLNARYSGSTVQEQFSELQQQLIEIKKKEIALNQKYENAEREKDHATKDRLVNEEYPALFKRKQDVLETFIRKYPSSPIIVAKFDDFAGDDINLGRVEPVYELLSEDLKNNSRIMAVAQRIAIAKRTQPGMDAPDFSQNDTSGNKVGLSDFKGKYVLIEFWASWCGPCRAENPRLIALFDRYKQSGFHILGVSLDGEKQAWKKAIIHDNINWSHVSDLQIFNNAVALQYGINSIPQNILVSPDGKIIAKNLRGSVLEKKLAEIFK